MNTSDVAVSVAANAVGWELFSADGRPVTYGNDGVGQIETTDEETELCLRIARRVLGDVRAHYAKQYEHAIKGKEAGK